MVSHHLHPNLLYQRLQNVVNLIQKAETEALPTGLTLAQGRVLDHLGRAPWPLTHKVLALELGCSGGNITMIVDGLERKGLVTRTRDKDDRRKLLVALTDEGKRLSSAFFIDSGKAIEACFEGLSVAGREDLAAALNVLAVGRSRAAAEAKAGVVTADQQRERHGLEPVKGGGANE